MLQSITRNSLQITFDVNVIDRYIYRFDVRK